MNCELSWSQVGKRKIKQKKKSCSSTSALILQAGRFKVGIAELIAEVSAIVVRGVLSQSISGLSGFIILEYLPMAYRVFLNDLLFLAISLRRPVLSFLHLGQLEKNKQTSYLGLFLLIAGFLLRKHSWPVVIESNREGSLGRICWCCLKKKVLKSYVNSSWFWRDNSTTGSLEQQPINFCLRDKISLCHYSHNSRRGRSWATGFPLMPEFCLIRNRELSIPLAGLCVGSGLHPCAGSSKQTNPVRDVFLARWLNVMSHLSGVKQVFKREKSALATLGLLNLSDLTTFRSATELGHLSSLRASLNW